MDWGCANCSFENKPTAPRCQICYSARPRTMHDDYAPETKKQKVTKGKAKSWKPTVIAFKEDERMLAKKINQMRECLGAGVSDEQLKHLLQKNAGSVSFAISAYYENLSKVQKLSSSQENDSKYWMQSMEYNEYYLGSCIVEAHVTRREDGALKQGARLFLRSEGSILRIMTSKNVVVGRIDEAWENIVQPLLIRSFIKVGANVIEVPAHAAVFSRFQLQLHIMASPTLWVFFKSDDASIQLKENLLQLLDAIKNKHIGAPSKSLAMPGETQGEAIEIDADVDTLYSSSVVENMYDSAKVHASLHGITLRAYQEQALQWMLQRELYEDNSRDGKAIGLSLRLETKANNDPDVHPLWEKRICFKGNSKTEVPFYINSFERLVSLDIPPPPKPCLGGILADDMGMGKTIMVMALILARTHVYTQDRSKMDLYAYKRGKTLVVCPLSLLHQWKLEFESRAPSLKVSMYYENKKSEIQELYTSDIVLTTYGVLGSEFGKSSELHRISWDRLILDEAHSIKNKGTTYFKSCSAINATHRWCLTGTPIQNSLDDVLALLTFLQYEPWNKTEWWNRVVAQPYEKGEKCALVRLKAILQPILLRRTKYTKDPVTHEPIVQLPPKNIQVVRLEFSPEERKFYQAVYTKSQGEFYGYVASGTAAASYVAIFALLLRLRQACDHPFLIVGKDADASVKKPNQTAKKNQSKEDYFAELSVILQEQSKAQSSTSTNDDQLYIKNRILEIQEEGLDCQECPVCLDIPVSPVLTPCAHLLCKECIWTYIENNGETNGCPVCRTNVTKEQLIVVDPPEKNPNTSMASNSEDWPGSAKLHQLLIDMKSIEPKRKVIVFSQWSHMLDLVQKTLSQHGYSNLRFDGSLKQEERERVLVEFNTNPDIQVLVISLKAGGVGLNLTAASVVIMLDPWWNPGIEDQAIDRVHRLGQTRDVMVKKYIVQDTVEDMILQLQQRKATLASTVLATAKSGADSDGRLSLSDLLKFFA